VHMALIGLRVIAGLVALFLKEYPLQGVPAGWSGRQLPDERRVHGLRPPSAPANLVQCRTRLCETVPSIGQ